MNETIKDIFNRDMDTILLHLENLPDGDLLLKEISGVTDIGNLRSVFLNMQYFLEKGEVPKSGTGYSDLPALVFGLSGVLNFLEKETEGKISAEDLREMSAAYFQAYQKLS